VASNGFDSQNLEETPQREFPPDVIRQRQERLHSLSRLMTGPPNLQPLEIVDEAQGSPELDRKIRELLCECFPPDVELFSQQRCWHNSTPAFSVVCRDEERIVGHVAIVDRQITCGGQPLRVAGVESLAVAPAWRRTNLSKELMSVAMDEATRRGLSHGLLFCVSGLERYYRGLGWQKLEQEVTMRDEQGRGAPLPAKNIVMHLSLAGSVFPPGPIDLQGPDW